MYDVPQELQTFTKACINSDQLDKTHWLSSLLKKVECMWSQREEKAVPVRWCVHVTWTRVTCQPVCLPGLQDAFCCRTLCRSRVEGKKMAFVPSSSDIDRERLWRSDLRPKQVSRIFSRSKNFVSEESSLSVAGYMTRPCSVTCVAMSIFPWQHYAARQRPRRRSVWFSVTVVGGGAIRSSSSRMLIRDSIPQKWIRERTARKRKKKKK